MKKNTTLTLVSILLLSFLSIGIFHIGTTKAADAYVNIEPTDDANLWYGNENPHGGWEHLAIRNAGSGGIYAVDILIKFDVSSIASDASVISAKLYLYYYDWEDNNPAGRDLNLYRATSSWSEDTVNWSNKPSYASQSTSNSAVPSSYGWMNWDVTSDVQSFVDGYIANYGWKITDENYWSGSNIPQTYFRSKEYGSNIPYLEIESIPGTVYVDDDYCDGCDNDGHIWGYDAFDSIQDGINAVLEGGTVHVNSGTYYEPITISKTIDLIGEDKNMVIIDAGGSGDVVYVSANYVNITGFTIQNSGNAAWPTRDAGIDLYSDYNIISDNIFYSNDFGIYAWNPCYNTVSGNTFISNRWATSFYDTGNDNIVSGNIFDNNDEGSIYLWNGVNYQIFGNSVTNTGEDGIILIDSDFNEIFENNIVNNNYGIRLKADLGESESDYNLIYHNNLINNNYNAYDSGTNTWYNTTLLEGNYYDDYTGEDNNCDGIGDIPYSILGGDNQDLYPFMNQDGWENNPPNADADGPYYANVNNAITFDGSDSTDSDGTITGYRWDWTNDGTYDTAWLSSATTTHSYSSAGTYTVKLQVKDDDSVCSTDTTTAVISIEGGAIPTADANGPYSGYVNYSITFSSYGSNGGSDGTVVSWYWTFGDGDVSSQQNPTHKYTASGTFTVTLKVTNNYGQTDTDTTTATITELLPGQTPPVADAGGPYSGVANSPITFDGSGSNDSDGTIVSYEWDFGDGTNGTGISPTHTYTTAGNYTVVLTVTDNESLTHSNSTIANINVSGPPTIIIAIDISNIEPIEEENEKTIPVTVFCYHQSVYNIHLEILESSNLTVTLLSPNITLNPGESRELLINIKAPKLEEINNAENKVSDETIILRAVGDGNITSNTEQINLKVIEKNATPGFEAIAALTAVGTTGALVTFFRRRNRNR